MRRAIQTHTTLGRTTPDLDLLLDLDGRVLVVDPEGGHWIRFVPTRVPVPAETQRGPDFSLTPHVAPVASGWRASATPIRSRSRGGTSRKTIVTGDGQSMVTTTGTQRRCSAIAGPR